jgi:tetratricopeptide (TPR) repeat protein
LALASLNLGWMYSKQAEQEAKHGRDPMPAWDLAVEAYGRCLEIQPDHGVALRRFVSLWFKRGMYLKETGGDPSLEFDAAVAVAQRTWDATPDDGLAVQRLGVAFLKRAVWGAAFSDDFNRARELLLEAVESYSRNAGAIADLVETLARNEDDMEKARRLRSLATEIRRAGAAGS